MLDVLYFWSIFHCKGSYDYLPFMAIAHQQDSRVSTVEACLAVGEDDSLSPSPLVLSHLVNHSKSNRLVRPVPSSIGRQTFRVPSILCLVLLRLCFSPTPPPFACDFSSSPELPSYKLRCSLICARVLSLLCSRFGQSHPCLGILFHFLARVL